MAGMKTRPSSEELIEEHDITDWVVLACQNQQCSIRYPSPSDDTRFGTCPLCNSESIQQARYPAEDDLVAPVKRRSERTQTRLWVLCDNIRSAANAGVIIRTADGAGFQRVTLCGITAKPNSKKIAKSALGAQEFLEVDYQPSALTALRSAKADGWIAVGLEFTFDSVALNPFEIDPAIFGEKVVVVLGHERAGIDPAVRELLDHCWHLEMAGMKGSHNVSAAFGACAYALRWITQRT